MVESTLNSTFNSNDAAAYLTEKSPKESKLTTFDKTGISSSQFSQGETLKDKIDQVGETVGDIMHGDIPSNQEISQFLDNMQRSLGRQQNLDTQGKRLASDLQYILKNTKSLLRTLNSDDTFQRFAKETAEFTKDLSETGEYAAKKLEKDSYNALGEAKELVYNVKEFLMYILRSGEFRRLMDDFTQLFSNISGNFERRHKKNLKQSVKSDVNREDTNASSTKQALKEVKDDVQKGKLVNQQDKDRIVERLNILFDKLFNNKEYNRAAQNLFNIMDIFSRRMDQLKKDPNMQLQDNEHFEQMMQDAEYIICKLVGKENWKSFTGEFWNLYSDIRNDKEANKFFTDLRSFLDDSIKNPEKFKEESERQKVQKFVDRAYALMERGERKYSDRFNELYDYLYDMYDNAAEQTSDLTDSVNKFARDMFTDNQGRPDIYVTQQSLIQLKNMMVPMIQEGLANIPLPRFESSDEYYNLWLDNIVLDGRGILPERFEFKAFTDIVLDVNSPVNKATTQIWTKIDKIDMDFKTVHFYYLRKSFPSIEDYGIADVTIRGMKLGLVWTIASKTDWPLRMKLKEVICTMDKFDIDVLQSKHRLLDEIGTTFFTGWIKREILNLMKEKVKAIFAPFVEELNNYFIEQKRSIDKNWSSESFMKNANAKLHEMTSSSQVPLKDKISRKGQEFKHEAKEKYEETKKTAQQKFHQFNQWFDEKMDWSKNFE